jgi:hypothetical protein
VGQLIVRPEPPSARRQPATGRPFFPSILPAFFLAPAGENYNPLKLRHNSLVFHSSRRHSSRRRRKNGQAIENAHDSILPGKYSPTGEDGIPHEWRYAILAWSYLLVMRRHGR